VILIALATEPARAALGKRHKRRENGTCMVGLSGENPETRQYAMNSTCPQNQQRKTRQQALKAKRIAL
jgi:hypothetical protein